MEWLKAVIAGEKNSKGPTNKEERELEDALRRGQQEAVKFTKRLIELGQKYIDDDQPMAASVLLFAAVHRTTGIVADGVDKSRKTFGPDSPVVKLWEGLEILLTAPDETEGMERLKLWLAKKK